MGLLDREYEVSAQERRRIAEALQNQLSWCLRSDLPVSVKVECREGEPLERIEQALSAYAACVRRELAEQVEQMPWQSCPRGVGAAQDRLVNVADVLALLLGETGGK